MVNDRESKGMQVRMPRQLLSWMGPWPDPGPFGHEKNRIFQEEAKASPHEDPVLHVIRYGFISAT